MSRQTRKPLLQGPAAWTLVRGDGYLIHAEPRQENQLAFAEAVARGLEDHPRWLSCAYLYDAAGSEMFERITEQPEYYQTRTEDGILQRGADALRQQAGDTTVVELGSGSSTKTRNLLTAWNRQAPVRYVPIDISPAALEDACRSLAVAFPTATLEGIASSYETALPMAAALAPLMLVFLGSTIGNFNPSDTDVFLDMVASHLSPGDTFLLGVDLIKDAAVLEAAYNDTAGYTRRFILNQFARMNRELGSNIPLDALEHVAYYNERLERIEIYVRFTREVCLELPGIGRDFRLAAGEMVLTEISRKFRIGEVTANLKRFGFDLEQAETDPDDRFGVLLFQRRPETPYVDNRKRRLATVLHRVRAETLELLVPLCNAGSAELPRPLVKNVLFHLQEINRYETDWLVTAAGQADISGTDAGPAVSSRTFPAGWVADHQEVAEISPSALRGVLDALEETRRQALDLLSEVSLSPTDPLTAGGAIYRLAAEHESYRQERILQEIQFRSESVYAPLEDVSPAPRPDRDPAGETHLIAAGEFLMGAPAGSETQDNEQPQHRVHLDGFLMDATPVTNRQFLEFLDDGGYEKPASWGDAGWKWRSKADIQAPALWRYEKGIWKTCHFDRWWPLDPCRPVMHVSWYEADAFARWAGKRLPREQEWEKAASWDPQHSGKRTYPWGESPPTAEYANLGRRYWEPTPVGSYPRGRSFYGCHQMLGDVWEWTASAFVPYPNFTPQPGRQQSASYFGDEYRVLRGGAWASLGVAVRNTLRRWARPEQRQMFAGFRCVTDASLTPRSR